MTTNEAKRRRPRQLPVQFEAETLRALRHRATVEERSMAAVVRLAVRAYLDAPPQGLGVRQAAPAG